MSVGYDTFFQLWRQLQEPHCDWWSHLHSAGQMPEKGKQIAQQIHQIIFFLFTEHQSHKCMSSSRILGSFYLSLFIILLLLSFSLSLIHLHRRPPKTTKNILFNFIAQYCMPCFRELYRPTTTVPDCQKFSKKTRKNKKKKKTDKKYKLCM